MKDAKLYLFLVNKFHLLWRNQMEGTLMIHQIWQLCGIVWRRKRLIGLFTWLILDRYPFKWTYKFPCSSNCLIIVVSSFQNCIWSWSDGWLCTRSCETWSCWIWCGSWRGQVRKYSNCVLHFHPYWHVGRSLRPGLVILFAYGIC